MLIKSQFVHIDTADNITMSCKATCLTCPISVLRLMFVLTYRTLATCSSFRASEALDVSLFGFMRDAIFPQGHPLVVVAARMAVTHTMGIADEERTNFMLLAEADYFADGFVAQITNVVLRSCLDLVLGSLQLSPSTRKLFASGLLFGNLAQLFGSLPPQRPDATACDNHGLTRVGENQMMP